MCKVQTIILICLAKHIALYEYNNGVDINRLQKK